MAQQIDKELIDEVVKKVRDMGHTGTAEVELRMMVTLCHSRNIGKTAIQIAEIVGQSLGRTGGSTRQDRDGGMQKSADIEDKTINDPKIYDKYTKDSWKG